MNRNFYSHFQKDTVTNIGKNFVGQFRKKVLREVYDVLQIKRPLSVLDIGPGRGEWMQELVSKGHFVVGCEASASLRSHLKENHLKVIAGLAQKLPVQNESFDMILAIHLVEHLSSYQEVLGFVAECNQILRPGGIFCCVCPNYLSWKEHFFDIDNSHHYPTTPNRMRQILMDIGLEIKQMKFYCGPFSSLPIHIALKGLWWIWPQQFLSTHSWKSRNWEKLYKVMPSFQESFLVIAKKPG